MLIFMIPFADPDVEYAVFLQASETALMMAAEVGCHDICTLLADRGGPSIVGKVYKSCFQYSQQ